MNFNSCFPGTRVNVSSLGLLTGIFSATNGITLSQVCEITGLEASAIQNWVKRGYVNPPVGRKYRKGQLARIILISILRETMAIEKVARILSYVNGNLLDRSDDIMDDSDIYQCLCHIVATKSETECLDIEMLNSKIEELLREFKEPYPGAKERLKLALEAIVMAYQSARLKSYVNKLIDGI